MHQRQQDSFIFHYRLALISIKIKMDKFILCNIKDRTILTLSNQITLPREDLYKQIPILIHRTLLLQVFMYKILLIIKICLLLLDPIINSKNGIASLEESKTQIRVELTNMGPTIIAVHQTTQFSTSFKVDQIHLLK
jgi:hypothetical protein